MAHAAVFTFTTYERPINFGLKSLLVYPTQSEPRQGVKRTSASSVIKRYNVLMSDGQNHKKSVFSKC